jgi:hypothetical protein
MDLQKRVERETKESKVFMAEMGTSGSNGLVNPLALSFIHFFDSEVPGSLANL